MGIQMKTYITTKGPVPEYLTTHKLYEAVNCFEDMYFIINDKGQEIVVIAGSGRKCGHLFLQGVWSIAEDDTVQEWKNIAKSLADALFMLRGYPWLDAENLDNSSFSIRKYCDQVIVEYEELLRK